MQVDANVSEADIGRVVKGQEVDFTVDAYPEKTFRGKVMEIRNAPTTLQNVVTYDVVIEVDNKDLKLKPGMTANISILIAHHEGVLKIPNAALRFRPEFAKKEGAGEKRRETSPSVGQQLAKEKGEEKLGRIWVLSREGKPAPISVTLGITNGTFSEVAEGDLKEGMEVIIEEISKKKSQNQGTTSSPFMRGMGR
jgi:HlyD family secretion protein